MAHGDAGKPSQPASQPERQPGEYFDPVRNAAYHEAQQYTTDTSPQGTSGDARTGQPVQPFDPVQNHRDWNAMMGQAMRETGMGAPQPRERTYGQLLIGNEYRAQQPTTDASYPSPQGTSDARTEQPNQSFDHAQPHQAWNTMMGQTMRETGMGAPQPRERTYGQLLIGNEYKKPRDSARQPRSHKSRNSGNSKKDR